MPTEHSTTKVLARGAHIHNMHAHVCHPAPAAAMHLLRPPPSRQLHSFTAAAAIPGAVHRCPQAHNFQPPPRRCKVPHTSPSTTICRLLPPPRAMPALTAHLARRGAATHRHEVLRQAGSARTPTAAPADGHRPLGNPPGAEVWVCWDGTAQLCPRGAASRGPARRCTVSPRRGPFSRPSAGGSKAA